MVLKFLKDNAIMVPKTIRYEIPSETELMVDSEFDLKLVELIITNNLLK